MSRHSFLAVTILLTALSSALPQRTSGADLLLLNSNVITMNPRQPVAQAIAIRDGRIIWVGSNREARRRFNNAAQTTDLQGATILPRLRRVLMRDSAPPLCPPRLCGEQDIFQLRGAGGQFDQVPTFD
jgi:hypothetical protein